MANGKWNDVKDGVKATLCWKRSAESTAAWLTCADGWDKHDIGGEDYCLKEIGSAFPKSAQAECKMRGASLPLPTSSDQNDDLRRIVDEVYDRGYFIIGVSDSGLRLLNGMLKAFEGNFLNFDERQRKQLVQG